MPSSFPGMDPYLEGSLWTSVHTQLGVEIQRQLMPLLRPRYIALTTERFVIATVDSGTETGETHAPHLSVEIRDVADRRLVTDIEILSPVNKRSDGHSEYLTWRHRLLLSRAHLMEIDLLRSGQRVPTRGPLPPHPYFVLLSRVQRRPLMEVWPIPLEAPLPVIPVPLLPGDADVPLDLQRAFSNVYDLAGYDLVVNYSRPPDVPLSPREAAWAQVRLRMSGTAPGDGTV